MESFANFTASATVSFFHDLSVLLITFPILLHLELTMLF